jgi:hypothetical protein
MLYPLSYEGNAPARPGAAQPTGGCRAAGTANPRPGENASGVPAGRVTAAAALSPFPARPPCTPSPAAGSPFRQSHRGGDQL